MADYDNDSLLDGEELMYNTIPTDPDCDEDGLKDFEEINQFIPIKKINLNGQLSDISRTITIEEPGNYSIKITSRNTLDNLRMFQHHHRPHQPGDALGTHT